jgi:predicted deacetylase
VSRHVLVCVHDVTPRHADRLREIDAVLATHGLRGRYSMLVVPDFWGEWPLDAHPAFCAWLRARQSEGVEMLLHGYYHRDDRTHDASFARFASRYMTAAEGEFLGLERGAADDRIARGQGVLERVLGQRATGFVAPAWLYGPGTRAALRTQGLEIAEDHLRVWSPNTGRTLLRSPVVSYASRTPGRVRSSIAWSRLSRILLWPLRVVRFAVHPHDLDVPRLAREIDGSLRHLLSHRSPLRYRDLAEP